MAPSIPTELRSFVEERAHFCCEYCLTPQAVTIHKHEPDHIIPIQHGGTTEENNLALACMRCNRFKGPNLGSLDPQTGKLVPFFNPRQQNWSDHFVVEGGKILPISAEGRVTEKIFKFNDEESIEKRLELIDSNLFPQEKS